MHVGYTNQQGSKLMRLTRECLSCFNATLLLRCCDPVSVPTHLDFYLFLPKGLWKERYGLDISAG